MEQNSNCPVQTTSFDMLFLESRTFLCFDFSFNRRWGRLKVKSPGGIWKAVGTAWLTLNAKVTTMVNRGTAWRHEMRIVSLLESSWQVSRCAEVSIWHTDKLQMPNHRIDRIWTNFSASFPNVEVEFLIKFFPFLFFRFSLLVVFLMRVS